MDCSDFCGSVLWTALISVNFYGLLGFLWISMDFSVFCGFLWTSRISVDFSDFYRLSLGFQVALWHSYFWISRGFLGNSMDFCGFLWISQISVDFYGLFGFLWISMDFLYICIQIIFGISGCIMAFVFLDFTWISGEFWGGCTGILLGY